MQTFIPMPDTHQIATCLDRVRLGKQRVETLQILQALIHKTGWIHHPAIKLWRGHESALAFYGLSICDAWTSLGYADTCRQKILNLTAPSEIMPDWWGREEIHNSHKAALLWKGACDAAWKIHKTKDTHREDIPIAMWKLWISELDPTLNHYNQFNWKVPMAIPNDKGSLPYVWLQ